MSLISSTTCRMIVVDLDGQPGPPRAIPLTGVEVQAWMTGPTCLVKLRRSDRNDSETPVEATYVFPLEEGSAVRGLRVTIDGERLEGRVESRDDVFDQYDGAHGRGEDRPAP